MARTLNPVSLYIPFWYSSGPGRSWWLGARKTRPPDLVLFNWDLSCARAPLSCPAPAVCQVFFVVVVVLFPLCYNPAFSAQLSPFALLVRVPFLTHALLPLSVPGWFLFLWLRFARTINHVGYSSANSVPAKSCAVTVIPGCSDPKP